MSDREEPDPLTFAMDRAAIWKAAHACFHDAGMKVGADFGAYDVLRLAEFLAGDKLRDLEGEASAAELPLDE